MLRKEFVLGLFVCLFITSPILAHPPSDIKLSYDLKEKILRIEMRHPTIDARKDCIRKLEVRKNLEDPLVFRYNIQPNTMNFIEEVAIDAKEDDTLTIKAYSRDGGSATASLLVKAEEEADQAREKESANENNSPKDKNHGRGY